MTYDDKYRSGGPEPQHNVIMEGRERLTVTGVEDVGSFDEDAVAVQTVRGRLVIRGEGLRLEKLSLDTGEIIACGRVDSMEYQGEAGPEAGGFLSRLFR